MVRAVEQRVFELNARGDARGAKAFAARMSDSVHWDTVLGDSVAAALARGTVRLPPHRSRNGHVPPLRLTRARFDVGGTSPEFDIDVAVPWPVAPAVSPEARRARVAACLRLLRLKRSLAGAEELQVRALKDRESEDDSDTRQVKVALLRREVVGWVRAVHDSEVSSVVGDPSFLAPVAAEAEVAEAVDASLDAADRLCRLLRLGSRKRAEDAATAFQKARDRAVRTVKGARTVLGDAAVEDLLLRHDMRV